MLRKQHKTRGWNCEFQYLSPKIIGKMFTSQYLSTKTIHFPFTLLTLSPLFHISFSPPRGSDSTLSHSLSVLDAPYLSLFSCILPKG